MSDERLFINWDERSKYKDIRESDGDLKGVSNIELFLISMMFGYYVVGKKKKLTSPDGFIRLQSVNDTTKLAILNAIAIADTEDMSILADRKRAYSIAAAYASAGIDKFHEYYFTNEHAFLKRVEIEVLMNAYEDQKIAEHSESE